MPTAFWSSQQRKEKEAEKEEEKAKLTALIEPNSPHLAGGENPKSFILFILYILSASPWKSKNHKSNSFLLFELSSFPEAPKT